MCRPPRLLLLLLSYRVRQAGSDKRSPRHFEAQNLLSYPVSRAIVESEKRHTRYTSFSTIIRTFMRLKNLYPIVRDIRAKSHAGFMTGAPCARYTRLKSTCYPTMRRHAEEKKTINTKYTHRTRTRTRTYLLRLHRVGLPRQRLRYEQVQPTLICHGQLPVLQGRNQCHTHTTASASSHARAEMTKIAPKTFRTRDFRL